MNRKYDRRGFLRVSAQGAAAAGLASVAGGMSLPGMDLVQASLEDNPAVWIDSVVRDFFRESPLNSLRNAANEKAWADPLVGFSRGDDSLFSLYKDRVGPFHWTPLEIFQLTFPEVSAKPDELTVITWILPQTEATKADHRRETMYPSERWARSRLFGEEFNDGLRRHVAERLVKSGLPAVAPALSPQFRAQKSERYVLASNWSERHAAYASGLGTFGLCDGLITAKGKAMRCGSVVAKIKVPATPRPYEDHHAYCLFYAKGTCGQCISRCPGKAITKSGHDKVACQKYVNVTANYVNSTFGLKTYGCGFCQVGVPCESQIPV